tara:strand:- start:239 stop:391 length:153 start_codon:yes stop_codon:yes gene_type:complete
MDFYTKYSILLEDYRKLKKELKKYKKNNKKIEKPVYIENINELDYPPQAF